MHGQGWTITSFDWRGQGGSGRLTDAGNCGHIESFDQFVGDLRAFHADWAAATPGPHVVMGHSMGGHLVLRALVEGAIAPEAAVLVAPMLGFKSAFGPFSERVARILGGVGDSSRPAWKGKREALHHRDALGAADARPGSLCRRNLVADRESRDPHGRRAGAG
ncbi:MAG: alpha/beta fold hydrolase [Sphingomonas sp.]